MSLNGMVNENPLGPGDEAYRTEIATDEVDGPDTAATSSPPWIAIGLGLLVVFLGLLAYAVVLPLLR
jgi:hypothetical protein